MVDIDWENTTEKSIVDSYGKLINRMKLLSDFKGFNSKDLLEIELKSIITKYFNNDTINYSICELKMEYISNSLISDLRKYDKLFNLNKILIDNISYIDMKIDQMVLPINDYLPNKEYLISMLGNIRKDFIDFNPLSIIDMLDDIDNIKKRIFEFDRINTINKRVATINRNKSDINKELIKKYGIILRGYKSLNHFYPVVVDTFLREFIIDKNFYIGRYFNPIMNLIESSYKYLLDKDFNHSYILIKKISDIKHSFNLNLEKITNIENEISKSKDYINDNEIDISNSIHSIYSKTFNVISYEGISKDLISDWNIIEKRVVNYKTTICNMGNIIFRKNVLEKTIISLMELKNKAEKQLKNLKIKI